MNQWTLLTMQLKATLACFAVACVAQISIWALYMSDRITLHQFWTVSPPVCIAIVSFVYTVWLIQADDREVRRGFEVKMRNQDEK